MIRNVAVVGHLHHGKTALMDMLVFETHKLIWDADKPVCEGPYPHPKPQTYFNDRYDTLTHTYYPVNGKFPSSHLQCLLFYQRHLGNLICCI